MQSYEDADGVQLTQPKVEAFIGKYTEVREGADKSSLTPEGILAWVSTYAEVTTGADVSGLNPENVTAMVTAYEELAFGADVTELKPDEITAYFISCIRDALKSHSCNYTYHPVFYCDKADHEAIAKHFKDSGKIDDPYEYCFVKDPIPYKKQNEWRIIIHDIDNEFADVSNNGLNIQTGFRDRMPIFETSVLHTMRISKNFLE